MNIKEVQNAISTARAANAREFNLRAEVMRAADDAADANAAAVTAVAKYICGTVKERAMKTAAEKIAEPGAEPEILDAIRAARAAAMLANTIQTAADAAQILTAVGIEVDMSYKMFHDLPTWSDEWSAKIEKIMLDKII